MPNRTPEDVSNGFLATNASLEEMTLEAQTEMEVTLVVDDKDIWHGFVRTRFVPAPKTGPAVMLMPIEVFLEITGKEPTKDNVETLKNILIEEGLVSREM